MSNLWLINTGSVDVDLPRAVSLPRDCEAADGINGYFLDRDGAALILRRAQTGLLRSQQWQVVGWIRCGTGTGEIYVQP